MNFLVLVSLLFLPGMYKPSFSGYSAPKFRNLSRKQLIERLLELHPEDSEYILMKFGEEEVEVKDYVPDSLNMRVVGMWPFGQGQAIEGSGDTVYVGSGAGIMVFEVLRELVDSAYLEKIGDYRPHSIRDVVMAIEKFDRYLVVSYKGLGLVVLEASDVSDIREICMYPMDDNLKVLRVVGSVLYGISDSMLWVFDVSDPQNIQFLASCYVDRNLMDFDTSGSYLYVGTWDGHLYGIDVSDVRNPQEVWYRLVPWGAAIEGVRSREGWIYVSTTADDGDFTYNLLFVYRHYGGDSVVYKGYRDLEAWSGGDNMDLRGDYLYQFDWGLGKVWVWYIGDTTRIPYVVDSSAHMVYCYAGIVAPLNSSYVYTLSWTYFGVLDAAEPGTVDRVATHELPYKYIKEMVKVGDYLLIPDGNRHLWIIDVSNVSYPELSYYIDLPFVPEDMEVYNDRLYISRTDRGFCVYDVSNPLNITLMASLGDSVSGRDITINYPYVYLYREDVGLYTLDVSDLGNIRLMNLDSTVRYKGWDAYLEDTLFFAATTNGFKVYTINDYACFKLIAEYIDTLASPPSIGYNDIVIHNDTLYLASTHTIGDIIDVSDIKTPEHIIHFSAYSPTLKVFKFPYLLIRYVGLNDDFRAALLYVNNPYDIFLAAYYRVLYRIEAIVGSDPYIYGVSLNTGLIIFEAHTLAPGVAEENGKEKSKIKYYISSNSGVLVAEVSPSWVGKCINFAIYDITGRTVESGSVTVNCKRISLDIASLKSGVYFVEIGYEGDVYRGKFVKFGR